MSCAVTSSIEVKVLCFAQLRDGLGGSEFSWRLPVGSTGGELLRVLANARQAVAPLLAVSRLAVNAGYASAETVLLDGDEVAVIPPVSGG